MTTPTMTASEAKAAGMIVLFGPTNIVGEYQRASGQLGSIQKCYVKTDHGVEVWRTLDGYLKGSPEKPHRDTRGAK